MVLARVADAPAQIRLAGLALVSSSGGHFAALAFDGDTVVEQIEGRPDNADTGQRLVELADGGPVISDAPRRALEVLSRAGAGSIILLHDGDSEGNEDRRETIAALPLIIEGLSTRGLHIVPLTKLLAERTVELSA